MVEILTQMEGDSVPELFKCPICLDVLSSPYTSVCGHTCCQRCWLKLDGDKQKVDVIIGRISSIAVHCPICRTPTFAGPNHNLRNHIGEKYGKELTNTTYELAVEQLKEELRDEIRKEEEVKVAQRIQEMQDGFSGAMRVLESQARYPSFPRPRRVDPYSLSERLKQWFWKFVGFSAVIAIIIAPFLLTIWTYNALRGQ